MVTSTDVHLAQFIGALLGATVVYLHYLPHWKETKDAGTKLGVFAAGPAIAELHLQTF